MGNIKKGIFFSTDALIALSIIIVVILVAFPVSRYTKSQTEIHYDIITTLSSLKIGEINESYIQSLVNDGTIKDPEKTILEQIGEFYVTDVELAKSVAMAALSELDTKENIALWYENTLIFSKSSIPLEQAKTVDATRQIISGIQQGQNVTGFSARALISSSARKQYFYFGGYVGDGNISIPIKYDGNITEISMELAINNEFEVYVNNISKGKFSPSPSEFTPSQYNFSTIGIQSSVNNILELKGINLHIAGGFIKINYKSEVQYEKPVRYNFPGITGLINIYDGFYIPKKPDSLFVSLHLDTKSLLTFLNIGNKTIYQNYTNQEETITFSNAELSSILDYDNLWGKTIPLRFGLENISYFSNISKRADVFSVTDLSGSMAGSKITQAKAANNLFLDILLNNSNNKVGLVGYETLAYDTDFYPLSKDINSLKNIIANQWDASGNTCICCGINKAVKNLVSTIKNKVALVVYYNLENNANDQSGNNNHGTIFGDPFYSSGISGNYLELSSGDYIEMPDVIDSSSGTISFWMKPTVNRRQTIFDASTSSKYFFIDIDNSKRLRFWMEDYKDTDFVGSAYSISSLSLNQWHHVAAIWNYDGSPATKLYLNGNLVDKDTNTAKSIPLLLNPYIGKTRSDYTTLWNFDGGIDDFRIYSKALGDSEINALAQSPPSTCGNSLTEIGELCDGQSEFCYENGFEGRKQCNPQCNGYASCDTTGICGDGYLNQEEQCDDGNNIDDDGCSSICKIEDIYKSMVVMSDGQANQLCSEQGTENAKQDAIQAACDAKDYGIKVNAVGFGSKADVTTLEAIAACGNGSYYFANIEELAEIYKQIANNILETTYSEQTLETSDNISTILYPDSYIEFNYTSDEIPYGLIITTEKQFDDAYSGTFTIPDNSTILETLGISYSGPKWTDSLKINDFKIYHLADYGLSYIELGDPYSINIHPEIINDTNIIEITTGLSPSNSSAGSIYNKIISTVLKSFSSFTEILPSAKGCIWTVQFEDNSVITTPIPSAYQGLEQCNYKEIAIDFNVNDAFQVAVFKLLSQLDLNSNNKVDIKFTEQDLEIEINEVQGIPYAWSTEVKAVTWR